MKKSILLFNARRAPKIYFLIVLQHKVALPTVLIIMIMATSKRHVMVGFIKGLRALVALGVVMIYAGGAALQELGSVWKIRRIYFCYFRMLNLHIIQTVSNKYVGG